MQLKLSTDYAIRIVLYLSIVNGMASARELSSELGIPNSFVYKITKKLQDVGIVKCEVGIQGGACLMRKPSEISLYDIVNTMEPTIKINRCLEPDEFCSRSAVANCPVRKFYTTMQNAVENNLKQMTLETLLNT